MKKKFVTIIPIIPIVLFLYHTSWAYDGEVHSKINEAAVRSSQLDSVLSNQIGIDNGIDAELTKGSQKKEIWEWIAFGGEAEDYGMPWDIPFLSTRAFNHFHDPLKDWYNAGLDSIVDVSYRG